MSDSDVVVVEPPSKKRKSSSKRKRSSGLIEKSETMKGTETEFEEFVIDRTTTPQRKLNVNEVEKSEENGSSSQWRKRLESTLLGGEQTPPTEKRARNNRYKKTCFNCDGEHNLYDCPLPRDHRRIMKNKRKSADEMSRRQQINNGLTKHIDKGFKPGELSEELRSALGLEHNDIPEHVYRMRRLGFIKGYPPGWLRKAVKSDDDHLKFFTSDSKTDEVNEKLPVLDVNKIIWYPGFNGDGSRLNDMETFKVPPQHVFWEVYQKELQDQYKAKQKNAKKQSKKKSTHKKFDDDDDDVVIVEVDQKTDKFTTPGEENVVSVLNGSSSEMKPEAVVQVAMGESMLQTIGAPVLNRHLLTDVASLEAFAVGIQPFESREEEVVSKGNFRKLMDNLKVFREQLTEVKETDSSDDVVIVDDDSENGEKDEVTVRVDPNSLKRVKKRSGKGSKRQKREDGTVKPR